MVINNAVCDTARPVSKVLVESLSNRSLTVRIQSSSSSSALVLADLDTENSKGADSTREHFGIQVMDRTLEELERVVDDQNLSTVASYQQIGR